MMWRLGPLLLVGVARRMPAAAAEGLGFLTEPERLASYCAGVSGARMSDMSAFLASQCGGSQRHECGEVLEALEKANAHDRLL
jgi:hypothetical protein